MTKRARPGAYSPELGPVDLPWGGCAVMRRPRATRRQEFATRTPGIQRLLGAAVRQEAGEVVEEVPVEEVEELCGYLADNTLRLEGVAQMDWSQMTPADRRDFYDSFGVEALLYTFIRFSTLLVEASRPMRAAARADAQTHATSEEE